MWFTILRNQGNYITWDWFSGSVYLDLFFELDLRLLWNHQSKAQLPSDASRGLSGIVSAKCTALLDVCRWCFPLRRHFPSMTTVTVDGLSSPGHNWQLLFVSKALDSDADLNLVLRKASSFSSRVKSQSIVVKSFSKLISGSLSLDRFLVFSFLLFVVDVPLAPPQPSFLLEFECPPLNQKEKLLRLVVPVLPSVLSFTWLPSPSNGLGPFIARDTFHYYSINCSLMWTVVIMNINKDDNNNIINSITEYWQWKWNYSTYMGSEGGVWREGDGCLVCKKRYLMEFSFEVNKWLNVNNTSLLHSRTNNMDLMKVTHENGTGQYLLLDISLSLDIQ